VLSSDQVKDLYKKYSVPCYSRAEGIVLAKGKGSRIWTPEGKEYLDFTAGIGVTSLGHCHPAIIEAARDQIERVVHTSNSFFSAEHAQLAEKLCQLSGLDRAFFSNSGAEANEGAIKFARRWGNKVGGGRYEIITFRTAFHGRTIATISATGTEKIQDGYAPLLEGFVKVPAFDLNAIEGAITDKTVAIMFEPIMGRAGLVFPAPGFYQGLKAISTKHNLLIITDEMQTGIGRTGKFFNFEHEGFKPDILTLAKGVATGFPIGVTLCRADIGDVISDETHGTTFGGNPLSARIGLVVSEIVSNPEFLKDVTRKGERFLGLLKTLVDKKPKVLTAARGRGLMIGLSLKVDSKEFRIRLANNGLVCITAGPDSIRIYPPLVASDSDIDEALGILGKVCDSY